MEPSTSKGACEFILLLFSHQVMSDYFVTPWTVAPQAPLSMGFPRQDTGVGCHFLLQGIFPTQGLNPGLPHWQAESLLLRHLGSPRIYLGNCKLFIGPELLPFRQSWKLKNLWDRRGQGQLRRIKVGRTKKGAPKATSSWEGETSWTGHLTRQGPRRFSLSMESTGYWRH